MTEPNDDTPTPLQEEERAIDLIARSPEGKLLHRYLRRVLEAVYDVQDDGALRVHTGRRTLARDLMRLMAAGIEDTRERNAGSADNAILTRSSGAVRTGRAFDSVRDYVRAAHDADQPSAGFPGAGRSRSRGE